MAGCWREKYGAKSLTVEWLSGREFIPALVYSSGGGVCMLAEMKCPHFSHFDYTAIDALRVLSPLEPRDKSIQWARGSIRDADYNELIITGPRLPVLFSGCRFNSIVFSMRPDDEPTAAFEAFMSRLINRVESAVASNPEKFKPGCKNVATLHFDKDISRPSSYSVDMPNEFRVKLAVRRGDTDDQGEVVDTIETVFTDEEGLHIEPIDILSGSEMIPIFRVGYYRNGNKFGLNVTLLKGVVSHRPNKKSRTIDFNDLMIDFPV